MGNLTSQTLNGATTAMSYNAADQLTSAGARTFGYDANGNQTTLANGYTPSAQVVSNGGVESGQSPWQTAPAFSPVSTAYAHSGTASADLQTYAGSTEQLSQTVTLPQQTTKVTLSYWLYYTTSRGTGSCTPFHASIQTSGGGTIFTLPTPCPTGANRGWQQVSVDVSPWLTGYAGQQVRVVFQVDSSGTANSDYYLDDVSLSATYNVQSTATTTYAYNALNQQTQKTLPDGTGVSYTYDSTGNLLTQTDGGGTVTYGYDATDQVTSVTDAQNQKTTVSYDQDGNRTQLAMPNGITESMSYNPAGQLTRIWATSGSTTLTSFGYSYTNPVTSKLADLAYSVTDVSNNTTNYTYDALNRMTQAIQKNSGGSQIASYGAGYDPASNLTSLTRTASTTTMTYNAVNELTQAGTTTYSYDLNGNRTGSSAGESATFNAANQTTSITPAGGTAITMAYTGSGQGERTYAGATNYRYAATGVRSTTGGSGISYVTALPDGMLISEYAGNSTYDYLTDGEGSVVGLVNSSGQLVNQYSYDPWGKMTSLSGSVVNQYYWHGYQQADPTGSQPNRYYTGSTYYDATTAQDTGLCDPGEDAGPPGEDEQDLTGAGPGYECPGPGSTTFHRSIQIPGIACLVGGDIFGTLCCRFVAHCFEWGGSSGSSCAVPEFQAAGIPCTSHFPLALAGETITGAQALNVYQTGKIFYDPRHGNCVKYGRVRGKGNYAIPYDQHTGEAITIYQAATRNQRWKDPTGYC